MVSSEPYDPELEVSLMGPIRMANKYQMVNIYKHLVLLVETQWPQSLIGWDHYQNAAGKYPRLLLNPAAAIALASENGVKRILPVAFSRIMSGRIFLSIYSGSENTLLDLVASVV